MVYNNARVKTVVQEIRMVKLFFAILGTLGSSGEGAVCID
jgi:hypothetical protein